MTAKEYRLAGLILVAAIEKGLAFKIDPQLIEDARVAYLNVTEDKS